MGDGGSCFRSYLNQWISRDPFPGYGRLPQSQNGYSYVHGNPVNYTDPKGECVFFGIDTLICGSIVFVVGTAYLAATPNTSSININSSLSLPDVSQIVSPRHQNEQIALLALALAITQSDVPGFSESFPAEAPNIPFVGGIPWHPPMLNIPTGFDLLEDPCWLEGFSPASQIPRLPGFDLQSEIGPQIHNSTLRTNLGLTDPNYQAHHIIPSAVARNSRYVQHLIKAGLWDNSSAENGIALPKYSNLGETLDLPTHLGSHPAYSNLVQRQLDILESVARSEGWSNEQRLKELQLLTNDLKKYIQTRPGGSKVNEANGN